MKPITGSCPIIRVNPVYGEVNLLVSPEMAWLSPLEYHSFTNVTAATSDRVIREQCNLDHSSRIFNEDRGFTGFPPGSPCFVLIKFVDS
ncbi:MAG TPA: hypothetical protein PLN56_06610 [Methanoregulaceae archaeon]|nr:MAG: hypothetical protein IPI71_07215 [Methanolinea sp.]HPD10650.1 hypothetical protein [Methanoregulaceae archaeon]